MAKRLLLSLLLAASLLRAAVPSVSLPLDWTTANGISRANLNLNPIALRDGLNVAIDSLNPVLAALSGWSSALAIASNQDLILKVDADANGTHKLVVTSNNLDSILRIHEDGTARIFDHLAVDSNITTRKVSAADSVVGAHLKTVSGNLIVGGTGAVTGALSSGAFSATTGSFSSTLGVTGKLTGSDSLVTLLGLRIGTNANLLWASDNMITTPDSVTVDGVVRVGTRLRIGTGTPTYQTKRLTAIGNSFDNTAIQMENTDVTLDADGRIYNWGITDASATDGRLDLTIPGVRTILSAWKSGNVGIGSTTDGGEVFQVTGTSRFTGAGAFGSTLGVTGKVTGSDTIAASLGFRAGSAGATDAQLYRSGANMWTTPDSLTVAGRLVVTGTVTADSIIATKFYTEDSYTGTLTGVSGSVTGTIRYTRIGKQVTIEIPQLIGTSNSTSCTITGMPAAIRPARRQGFSPLCIMDNTSVSGSVLQGFYVETDGTLALVWQGLTTGFTSSGTKGFLASIDQNNNVATMAFTYSLL